MAHFALLWKARTIEKYRQNYENEKYISIQDTNIPMPQKSLSQRLRCYRQDTQKRFSKIFHRIYPEGSSLSNFFLYLRTDQTCLNLVLKSLLGFLIGLGLTYLCFLFLVFQLSISLFHATIVSSIIGVLLTMGLAFSFRIRCLIFLLLPQFFSRAGRYTLTCYALVLILTGPATNTLKNSEVLTESMACRQEQIKTLLNDVKDTARRPLNAMRDSIKVMVQKIRLFARELKQTLLQVNRLTMSVLETIQSTFSWLQWLSEVCNKVMGSPFNRCLKVLKEGAVDYKRRFEQNTVHIRRLANKIEEVCSNVKHYRAICVFTDFVNGSFVASIRRRLKDYSERIRNLLYLHIQVHHSYSFSSNTSHSASQVAAGIVTEIRKRADPLLTWLSWSSCVTSLFLLLIIFRAKHYQHMFETRSRFDNKYITKELRDLDLNRLRHGRETILPLNKRERSKYVSTTSFRLVASEKIHLNRSIVFMAITTFKLLIHMVADYSLYWVLMTIRHHGKNQTPLPFGVPNAGMHITGTGRVADMFRSLLSALTSPLERQQPSPTNCLPDPHPPNLQRYSQIGILIFLLWFFALFEPYGLRLRHVIMGLYRPERAKARAEWLYNHILRTRGGFMKFARRKLRRSYKYCSEEKYTFKRWLHEHIPFCWIRCLLGISKEEAHCLLCGAKQYSTDPNTKLQKCNTQGCPGVYCYSCFSDIGELCTICLSPRDYSDLSDVSLEKGSSDESEDDSDGSNGGHFDFKNENEINDVPDNDSDDILFPKPLRTNKNVTSNITRNNGENRQCNMTRLKKTTFDLKDKTSETSKTALNIDFTNKQNVWSENVIKKIFVTITINSNWNVLENTSIIIHIMEIKINIINIPRGKTKENNNQTSCKENHVKSNSDQNQHKSQQTQNRPLSKNIGRRKDVKDKNCNGLDEKSDNNKGMQREGDNGDENIKKDDISNIEQGFPCCSLKQFNEVFCSYWLSMKNNLFNGCYFLTHAVINNTLGVDEKTNYKTRKKIPLEIPQYEEFRSDTEDSRDYRIFSFLAEREWVIKKTIRYESTEKEFSLLNEKPDTKTVEHLKEDLYSHIQYKKMSFAQCKASSSQRKKSEEFKENQDTRHQQTSCNPSNKQHVLVCEDCRFNCMCPGNRFQLLSDLPVILKDIKELNCKERGSIHNQVELSIERMSGHTRPKPKKRSLMERIKACLKSTFSRKRKKGKVCLNTSQLCIPTKVKTPSVTNKKRGLKYSCEDRCIQFDESDCPCHNRSIQVLIRSDTKADRRYCGQSVAKKCDPLCPAECDCKGHGLDQTESCDPLCPVECDCKGHGLDPTETCDSLCPVECDCKGHGLDPTQNCDPLCPVECDCEGHGLYTAETCDPLCPVECDCKSHGLDPTETCDPLCPVERVQNGHELGPTDTCDPLCPVECDCKGHGLDLTETCDPLCPAECQCKGEGLFLEKCDALCPKEYISTYKGRGIKINKCDEICTEECSHHVEIQASRTNIQKRTAKVEKGCCAVDKSENTCRQIEYIHKLRNVACMNKDKDVKLRCADKKSKKGADKHKKQSANIKSECCDHSSTSSYEGTKPVERKFCSCAIQCILSECCIKDCCPSSTCSCSVSIVSDGTIRSDFTGTDNTCYACYDNNYYEKPRRRQRRPRFVLITKHNQSTGTDTAIKCNIGTITNERGLIRENRYFLPKNNKEDVRVVNKFTQCRGVCTKKLVSFGSRVHIIPSHSIGNTLDIYTPSRYLLESQKYYNELFAYMPHVYPIRAIQERIHKRSSSQGSRSRHLKSSPAKRLEYASYVKQKKIIPKKRAIDPLIHRKSPTRKKLPSLESYCN